MTLTPPSALDSEVAVLGGILLSPSLYAEMAGVVSSENFYHPTHAAIFAAMGDCDRRSTPIDAVSIMAAMVTAQTDHRVTKHAEGEAYFSTLTSGALTVGLRWHAQRIRAKADRRRWIETMQTIAGLGYGDGDDDGFFEEAERLVAALSLRSGADDYRHIYAILKDVHRDVEARYERKQSVTGVPSGFTALDEHVGGYQAGQLIVVGGRPKQGKTALVMGTVEHAVTGANVNKAQIPCLVFSLEMSDVELGTRLVSSAGSVEGTRLRNGLLEQADWIRFARVAGELSEVPLFIYDRPANFARIRSVARRWRAEKTASGSDALVVVDYLQLISGDERRERGVSREQEVSSWSRGFKLLAKELRVPIVVLSQLNRNVESRGDKRPMMSDLRESGAIEQDADLVLLAYRDEVYNSSTEHPGVAEIIIAAGRSAPAGTVHLRFEGSYVRFTDCPPSMLPTGPAPDPSGKRSRPVSGQKQANGAYSRGKDD